MEEEVDENANDDAEIINEAALNHPKEDRATRAADRRDRFRRRFGVDVNEMAK